MFCKNCGAELLPDSVFCENCGTKVMAASVSAPSTPSQAYRQPIPVQGYRRPIPSQKKNNSKTGIIILIIVLIIASVIGILWATGVIGGDKEEPPLTEVVQPSKQPVSSPTQAIQPSIQPEVQETPDLNNTSEASATENPNTNDSPGVNGESIQLSTTVIPTADDFTWFTDKAGSWVYGITLADAYTLEDIYAFLGSWKGLQMIFDYDGTVLGYGYFTVTFVESGTNVTATLDWHYNDWTDGSHEELTNVADESMTGSFTAPTLVLGEAGNRIELILYSMEGKQYAEGIWTVQSGEEVRVALIRP